MLPTSAAATAVHGCPWWFTATFPSFPLLPWSLSLLSLGCRPLPLPFLSFPFLFLFGFSLGFLFFYFLSFLSFSLGDLLVKSSNDLVFG